MPRRLASPLARVLVSSILAIGGAVAVALSLPGNTGRAEQSPRRVLSYSTLAASAVAVLEHSYYTGAGTWNMCVPTICSKAHRDWGADSLTYALYLHWQVSHDAHVAPIMRALTATAQLYGPTNSGTSDVPEWDAISDLREFQVTGDPMALSKAEAAFAFVDSLHASKYALGACPSINYQSPLGGKNQLKTLETDSNYIKAALLLYQATGTKSYLTKAVAKYQVVRKYFLDASVPLYSVYVFDNGSTCSQLQGRFFGSVNGNMIWAGAVLTQLTKDNSYLAQAIATARAVARYLGDANGVYADLQAENDVVEPLIEAMYLLATADGQAFARNWLLGAASAAAADMTSHGTYGRFFDGPPPQAPVTAWQVNGALSLMIVAGALDPTGTPANPGYWRSAVFVPDNLSLPSTGTGTVSFSFTGRAVAIIGTIGEHCCQPGHARLFIDGTETFDRTGIWQDKSSSGRMLPNSVLFAWRWPTSGKHTITIAPGVFNGKEGGSFFHMIGYDLVR